MYYTYIIALNFSTYFSLIFLFISYKFLSTKFRNKLIYFLGTILFSVLWGFVFNLDGFLLVLITTEITAIMLLVMTYTQLTINLNFKKSNEFKVLLLLTVIPLLTLKPNLTSYPLISYYGSLTDVIAGDFFTLYQLLFTNLVFITIILTLIITFFSLFFILMYFNLKLKKSSKLLKNSQVYCLRKQVLQKQTKFINKLIIFQN